MVLTRPPQFIRKWLTPIDDHVIALEWTGDGKRIAAASVSGPITILDANTGAVEQTFAGHGFGTTSLSWHPNAKQIASSGQDGLVRIWDTQKRAEVIQLKSGAAWGEGVRYHPRGEYLVSIAGKKLKFFDEDYQLVRDYPDASHTIACLNWGLKGKEFLAAGYGGVRFYSPTESEPTKQLELKAAIIQMALSPDGKMLAVGLQDAAIHFWFTKTGKDLSMSGYPTKVAELSWDSESRYLATGGGELVTIWDCAGKGPANTTPIQLSHHENPISAVAFQHRGPLLASSCSEGKIALWYPGFRQEPLGSDQLGEGLSKLAWSPSDGRLAVGGEQGAVAVYQV